MLDFLDIKERLPSQEGRKAATRRVVNWVEEVDCVKLVCEDRRLVVLAFWNQLRIAHHSPLREGSVVRYRRYWIDASYQFSLNQGLWSITVCSIAEDILILSLDCVGLWPLLVEGRYFLRLLFSKVSSPFFVTF